MVLIKNLEMPESCADCPLSVQLYARHITECVLPEGRGDYCPLSEVKVWGEQRNIMVETHTGLLLEKVKEIIDGID